MPVIRKAPSFRPYATISVVIDYLGLTPAEKALYLHYLIQSQMTDTLSMTEEFTGLSTKKIRDCRFALANKYHLIEVDDQAITLLDIHPVSVDLLQLLGDDTDLPTIQKTLIERLSQLQHEEE